MVAPSVFDAYSHHPYAIGGAHNIAPEARPERPQITPSRWDIATLLKIFPDKPFYLSEYGYYNAYNAAVPDQRQPDHAGELPDAGVPVRCRFPQIRAGLVPVPRLERARGVWGYLVLGLVTTVGAYKRTCPPLPAATS